MDKAPAMLLFALVFLGASLVLLVQIDSQTVWSTGKALTAQPRFWPAVGLAMMAGFGALHFGQLRGAGWGGTGAELWMWLRGVEYAGWFLLYVMSVPYLGYLPASVLLAVVLTLRLGFRGWVWMGASLGLAVGIVVLFRALLRVHVPGGALYHALPDPLSRFFLTWL